MCLGSEIYQYMTLAQFSAECLVENVWPRSCVYLIILLQRQWPGKYGVLPKLFRPIMLLLKPLVQFVMLLWFLCVKIKAPDVFIVQNPPSVPILVTVKWANWQRRSSMIIDWHNFGYTLLALSLGRSSHFLSVYHWIMIAALSFLLDYEKIEQEGDSDESDDEEEAVHQSHVVVSKEAIYKANNTGTTSSKKKKKAKLQRVVRSMKKQQRISSDRDSNSNYYSPLNSLKDPQGFAEKLFSRLQTCSEWFKNGGMCLGSEIYQYMTLAQFSAECLVENVWPRSCVYLIILLQRQWPGKYGVLPKLFRPIMLLLKPLVQFVMLLWFLCVKIKAPDVFIVQNPPSVPILVAVKWANWQRRSSMIVDWHNFGYTLLALSLGRSSRFLSVYHWLLRQNATRFLMDDIYRSPGPLQFEGPDADSIAVSLCVEDLDYMGRIKEFNDYLDKVRTIVKPGCSQDILRAASSAMSSVTDILSVMTSQRLE